MIVRCLVVLFGLLRDFAVLWFGISLSRLYFVDWFVNLGVVGLVAC